MKYVFKAPDISCGHCKMRIESALGSADGVTNCTVDIKQKTVNVESTRSPEELIQLLDKTGYDAELVE